jgi:ABC-type glycerol-3-phosphate transport system permease component
VEANRSDHRTEGSRSEWFDATGFFDRGARKEATHWPMLTAAICMVVIPLFTQKYFVAGLTAGSIKG